MCLDTRSCCTDPGFSLHVSSPEYAYKQPMMTGPPPP